MGKHSGGDSAKDSGHQGKHEKAEPKAIVKDDPQGYSIKSPGRPQGSDKGWDSTR